MKWQFWKNKEDPKGLPGKCPCCGAGERIGEELIKDLKAKGELGEGYPEALLMPIPVMDKDRLQKRYSLGGLGAIQGISATVLTIHWDVCAQCGNMYCVDAEISEQPLQVQAQPAQMPAPNPGFLRRPI